jgi:hypothetical protein
MCDIFWGVMRCSVAEMGRRFGKPAALISRAEEQFLLQSRKFTFPLKREATGSSETSYNRMSHTKSHYWFQVFVVNNY